MMKGECFMAQTNVNIRMDEDLKKQADKLFCNLGMNMSTAFNVFVRQAIRTGGIPFEVTTRTDDFYNEYNQQVLKKSIARLNAGKGTVHDLIETKK
jgi:DNA-damage-inducible protein J